MSEAALFHRCRKALGLSTGEMARALLIAGDRNIRRWEDGHHPFPAPPGWRSKQCYAARARQRSPPKLCRSAAARRQTSRRAACSGAPVAAARRPLAATSTAGCCSASLESARETLIRAPAGGPGAGLSAKWSAVKPVMLPRGTHDGSQVPPIRTAIFFRTTWPRSTLSEDEGVI